MFSISFISKRFVHLEISYHIFFTHGMLLLRFVIDIPKCFQVLTVLWEKYSIICSLARVDTIWETKPHYNWKPELDKKQMHQNTTVLFFYLPFIVNVTLEAQVTGIHLDKLFLKKSAARQEMTWQSSKSLGWFGVTRYIWTSTLDWKQLLTRIYLSTNLISHLSGGKGCPMQVGTWSQVLSEPQ